MVTVIAILQDRDLTPAWLCRQAGSSPPLFTLIKKGEKLPDGTIQSKRERTFPAFYDGDYYYFHEIDKARTENKHMIVLKARRKGYSYKAGSMLARNYFFVKNSKNFVFAAQKEYLIGDGLLSKAWEFLSFIDDNTA